ncbi:MAG TPA: M56 family metallopeptidase [Gemmatimonadaceae bacterium]|nr:M56 family metallopeptidase [Gemmatimonadaceae bacterium]
MSDAITILVWLVKGTAVLVLAMAMSVGLRRAPAGARYVVWLAALAAVLLVPVLSTWTPLSVAVLPAEIAGQIIAPASSGRVDVADAPQTIAPGGAITSIGAPARGAVSTRGARVAIDTSTALLLAWAGIATLVVGWLALGAAKVHRIVARGRELTGQDWLGPMYDVADRLDLSHAPRLVMSSDVEMPFACGVLRPTIVLPASAAEWSEERRRVVLFHELAHVRRRDLVGHTVGRLTCALYWFHPLVWSAAKRLRAESERACDDLVLACGGARASDYASHLLDIVTGVRRQGAPATALPMADKREFEGRMLAILDPSASRVTAGRLQQVLVTIGFGALALSVAAIAPARAPAPQSRDARPASLAATTAPLDTVRPARLQPVQPSQRAERSRPDQFASQDRQRDIQQGVQQRLQERVQQRAQTQVSAQWRQPGALRENDGTGPDTSLLARILRTDKDAGVRKSAAWALQGRRDGVPLLLERLRVDEDEEVRETSAWALAGMGSDTVATALAQALAHDRSDDVRATAAWALGNMPSRANAAVLVAAMSDDNREVRQRALWALGQQRIETAPKRVVELLQDQDNDVRVMAAWVLGEIRDQSTLAAIRDAFAKERDHEVQQAEFRDLLLMGDRSQALIDRAMASDDPDIRARAVRLIAGHDAGVWPWPWPWPWPRPQP